MKSNLFFPNTICLREKATQNVHVVKTKKIGFSHFQMCFITPAQFILFYLGGCCVILTCHESDDCLFLIFKVLPRTFWKIIKSTCVYCIFFNRVDITWFKETHLPTKKKSCKYKYIWEKLVLSRAHYQYLLFFSNSCCWFFGVFFVCFRFSKDFQQALSHLKI